MNLLLENISIDWETLREQKTALIKTITSKHESNCEVTKNEAKKLDGILHLLDYLQDQAVESGIFSEEEIFGQ